MKTFTCRDLEKLTDKEILLLCIAHWKNILKEEEKAGYSKYKQKYIEFIYKRKIVIPSSFRGSCFLCERALTCEKCIMHNYWAGKFDKDIKYCMKDNSVFRDWLNYNKNATKSVIKALQRRLNVMRKEEKLNGNEIQRKGSN